MNSIKVEGIEYRFFDHLYAVSRCGKVLRALKPYTPTKHNLGYLSLGRQRLMHRVVAACWLPNPGRKALVHHKNGNKTDNRASNLEWVTPKEHVGDKHHGTGGKYVRTAETRAKLRANRLGKKDSKATRAKKAKILAANCPKRPIVFRGKRYPSVSAAARAVGLHLSTFRLWHLKDTKPA